MNKIKKVAVFTSTRAEYGLLFPLIKKIKDDIDLELNLLVSGSHLSEKFGYTIDKIIEDKFIVSAKFPFLSDDDEISESKCMSILSMQIADYFEKNKPDILIILGDRFELLPVASIALINNIPISHISGGDVTEGAIDNQIRHSITKMSHLHFPATEIYGQNILQMGEEEWRVCVSGETGLDQILNMNFIPRDNLFKNLTIPLEKEIIIMTLHPETINNQITPKFVKYITEEIVRKTNYFVVLTGANFDKGGNQINEIKRTIASAHDSIIFIHSLGQKKYYSLLKYSRMVIGNSSSGLVEVQSFKIPSINIGKRQKGRLSNPNVYHVGVNKQEILNAVNYVTTTDFKNKFFKEKNIFGDGNACDRIIKKIKSVNSNSLIMKKSIFSSTKTE